MENKTFKNSTVLSLISFCGLLTLGGPVFSQTCEDEAGNCEYAWRKSLVGRITQVQCVAACQKCVSVCKEENNQREVWHCGNYGDRCTQHKRE